MRISSFFLALSACSGRGGIGADPVVVTEADPSGVVLLNNAYNYTFEGDLDVPRYPIRAGADAGLSWGSAVTDLQCQELDPAGDIDNAALLVFPRLDEAEIELGLARDTLQQVDSSVYLSVDPGAGTSIHLSDLTFFGTDADIEKQFTDGSGEWLLLLTHGIDVGVGTRLLALLHPETGADATSAALDPQCGALDFLANIDAGAPIPMLRDGPWLLDWSALTANGMGNPFVPTRVSDVTVAWFADDTLDDLEGDFLNLANRADRRYTAAHDFGVTDDLSRLTDVEDGSAFPGFSDEGLWIVALLCKTCSVPAPLLLAVVAPE